MRLAAHRDLQLNYRPNSKTGMSARRAYSLRDDATKWARTALFTVVLALLAPPGPAHADSQSLVVGIEVRGVIGVATGGFVERSLKQAQVDKAALVVLLLDTPGGLVTSTREIIQDILASPVPVAVYVWPSGGRAASAGTYIVYASHLAAMAPATNLGAATPVQLGGVPGLPEPLDRGKSKGKDRENDAGGASGSAMDHKVINDAVAFIRSLAQLRGRNAEWAEKAVREAATLTAEEALQQKVIDFVAGDLASLLVQADGRTISVPGGVRALNLRDARVTMVQPDWRTRILAAITDPNVAYILLLAGIYGILFEFWNPGFVLPGVIGGISLLLALAALTVLPVDYAGLALILLGIAFMIAEAFTPGVIVLGLGGIVAFVAGSLLLFDPRGIDVDFAVAWTTIAAAAISSAAFLFIVLGLAIRARRSVVVSGMEEMVGAPGRVIDWSGDAGRVRVRGEIWKARAARPANPGEAVRVLRVEGLTLIVEADQQV